MPNFKRCELYGPDLITKRKALITYLVLLIQRGKGTETETGNRTEISANCEIVIANALSKAKIYLCRVWFEFMNMYLNDIRWFGMNMGRFENREGLIWVLILRTNPQR